jgi:hypothetical protein
LTSINPLINNDEAVSETLGYILLFAIALTAIAIILLTGNSIISNEKTQDNFQNMGQNFAIIQSDLNQMSMDGSPVKTTMIHMQGGTLALNTNATRLQINYGTTHYSINPGQMIFTEDTDLMTNLSIENGGVWEANDGYTSIISQPRIYVTPIALQNNTLVVNVIKLTSMNSMSADSGIGTSNVEMRYNCTKVYPAYYLAGGSATLTIDTNYTQAWEEFLNSTVANTNVNITYTNYNNGVEATLSPISELLISEHWINLTLNGLYGST